MGQGRSRKAPVKSPQGDLASRLAADRARALEQFPVSREIAARLDRFAALLLQWQATTNLVAPSTLPHLWTRHIADSLQLVDLAPQGRAWIDLGAGGGFPGLVVAIALSETPGVLVHLVESNGKKAAFLREAVRITGAPARVHAQRISDFAQQFEGAIDVVTARALAPLEILLREAYPVLKTGAQALFLKGQDVEAELTQAAKYWTMTATLHQSRTDPAARIVCLTAVSPRSTG